MDNDFANLMATVEIIDGPITDNAPAPDLVPGTRANCPSCDKELTVTQAGELRAHKCVREIDAGKTRGKPRGKGRGGRSRSVPTNVYDFIVGIGEDATEWSASRYVARAVPCDLDIAKQAASLKRIDGGGDVLFGPIVNALWPELPKGAQKSLIAIADHADLIACAFAWAEYLANLRGFVEAAREVVETEGQEGGTNNGTSIPDHGQAGFRFEPVVVGNV